MKRLLPFFSIAVVMAACNTNPDKIAASDPSATIQQAPVNTFDTAGFAEFQNRKAMNELAEIQAPVQEQQLAAIPVKKAKTAPVHKASKPVVSAPLPQPEPESTSASSNTSENSNSSAGTTVSTDSGSSTGTTGTGSTEVAQTEEKKGWSKAAKGAVIGGVTGAAAGAILNKKNRGVGAVIGGVIGAGGGFVLGRGMDKKDGRLVTTAPYNN